MINEFDSGENEFANWGDELGLTEEFARMAEEESEYVEKYLVVYKTKQGFYSYKIVENIMIDKVGMSVGDDFDLNWSDAFHVFPLGGGDL